jgi:hypothetical protein
MTLPQDLEALFARLTRFRGVWVSRGWSWDKRLDCVSSTFDVTITDEARRAVVDHFTEEWTSSSLRSAPPLVAEIAEATGGVRNGQALFTLPEVSGVMAYGLWWPWGGEGTNISMRVGLAGRTSHDRVWRLRTVFGATDD